MFEDSLYSHWIFYTSNNLYVATAFFTRFYFNGEDPLQSLRPRHRIAFAPAGLWGLLRFIVWFAWHDMRPQPAAGRENTMKPGEVNPWLRNQRLGRITTLFPP